eukprot:m.29944 g.29944  ORF g.29944 m.29944 type:complete len:163 (+) comp31269_c0_seq3:1694-2182(+)
MHVLCSCVCVIFGVYEVFLVSYRGLDIPQVQVVINSNVPADPSDYIHRVGRTARAGRGGLAVTLITQYDVERLHAVEDRIRTKLTEHAVVEKDVLKLLNEVAIARKEIELKVKGSTFGEKREINQRKKRPLLQSPKGKKSLTVRTVTRQKRKKTDAVRHQKI